MTLLKRKRVLAAEIETTPGTATSLSATDAGFNVYDVMAQTETEVEAREGQGAFGMDSSVPGARKGRVQFKLDASYDGTNVPTWATTFLPACGWVNSSGVFTPQTKAPGALVTDPKTLTLGVYIDGIRKLLRGCVGTFRLACPAGKVAVFEFDFMGVWDGVTDTAIISPTYPTAKGLRFASSTTTWNSVVLQVENLTLDSGNTMILREDSTDVSGYLAGLVTNRVVKITGNPEAKTVATQDRYGKLLDMSEHALTFSLDGPTNSSITIAAPKAQIISISEADRENMVVDEIEWGCNRNGSSVDQEASITFTASS
jgi:hypothetical protein